MAKLTQALVTFFPEGGHDSGLGTERVDGVGHQVRTPRLSELVDDASEGVNGIKLRSPYGKPEEW